MADEETNHAEAAEAVRNYNYVVKCAALDHVRLLNVKFGVEPEFFSGKEPPTLSYDVEETEAFFDAEKGVAFARVDLTVDARRSRKKTLRCNAQYLVGYSGLADCSEAAVKIFLRRVGPFSCYPYFRGLFASLDWSAGTQLPPLPIHREIEQEVVPNPAPKPPEKAKVVKKIATKARKAS